MDLEARITATGQSLKAKGAGRLEKLVNHSTGVTDEAGGEEALRKLNAELEQRIKHKTAQLEAVNKELESLSYSISHDLRAPLRSIRGFSEVLVERYAAQLDERGQEFLRRVCVSSQQMDKQIEDLLKLSRVGRSEFQTSSVDISDLAKSIVSDLRKSEPNRKVEVTVAPGLRGYGDERLLRIALDHLLRNAWKFTGNEEHARIEVGMVDEPQPAFFVRDNGAGFDMAYVHRLFGVFQRLHTASEFPGSGVGLATVQRIINRHGGRTWATGKIKEGATFYFTLPRSDSIS